MGSLNAADLPVGSLVLVDSAPIIYTLESHARFAARFAPWFQRHADGELLLAVTTITIAEVLAGPLRAGEESLARRYRSTLESWRVVDFTADIAESAARLRAALGLKLPDAVQAASALAINADALLTHDRDFRGLKGLVVAGAGIERVERKRPAIEAGLFRVTTDSADGAFASWAGIKG